MKSLFLVLLLAVLSYGQFSTANILWSGSTTASTVGADVAGAAAACTTGLGTKLKNDTAGMKNDTVGIGTALAEKSATTHTHTSLTGTGAITSSGGGVGYATGAGGTVTQGTSRTTGVTLSKLCGTITMYSAAQDSQAIVTFTLTNTFIAATDFVLIQHISATNGGAWQFSVVAAAGSCTITVRNVSRKSITEATPLRFCIIKSVTS